MQFPQLPAGAFLAAFLVIIPLSWHWRARNVAALSIIAWLFVVDIIYAVNALVWAGNVNNSAPVWCDITTKIVVGASFALPIATMCICKHLEMVASGRRAQLDHADNQRRMIFEGAMCFAVPAIFMALHYIVQGHRFDIVENFGCQATTYESTAAIILVWLPQLLFAVVTFIYAAVALRHFIHRRVSFAAHMQSSNSALTTNRYLRLIAMSISLMCWGTSLTALNLYNNVSAGLRPWISWSDVHSHFSRVAQFVTVGVPPATLSIMMLLWWATPVSSFMFFLFFGFGEEAKKEYGRVWLWFRRYILRRKIAQPPVPKPLVSYPRPVRAPALPVVELGDVADEHKSTSSVSSTPTKADSNLPYYDHAIPSPSTTESHDSDTACSFKSLSDDTIQHSPVSDERPPSMFLSPAMRPATPFLTDYRPGSVCSLVHTSHPSVESGVVVTIHRHAHTDSIV